MNSASSSGSNSQNVDAPSPIAPNPPRQIIVAVGVVHDNSGRVLLVREPDRGWEHPGGMVEQGEDLITGLLREIEEEAGVEAQVDRLLAVYSSCDQPYFLMAVFACTYLGGSPRASHEHTEVAWFSAADVPNFLIAPPPNLGPRNDVFNPGPYPVYRAFRQGAEIVAHDGTTPSTTPLDLELPARLVDNTPRQVVAVAGCVRDDAGRVLMVRSGWRGWEFPGGQVEQGEDLLSALHREVWEESGCRVEVGPLLGVYCNVGVPYVLQFTYSCRYAGGELTTSEETPEVAWFTPDEAQSLILRSPMRNRLADSLSDAPGIAYRVYQTRPEYRTIASRRLPE